MKKIILTEEEIEVLEQCLRGEFGQFTATERQQEVCTKLINDAEALQDELDAMDEVMATKDCDILLWYYNKYKAQQSEAN